MSLHPQENPSRTLVVRRSPDGVAGAFATRDLAAGPVVCAFTAAFRRSAPSRHTLQVGENLHVELSPTELAFVNHGCAPNVAFDVERWVLVTLAPVRAGDELRFFYPSTEWEMQEPFDCRCGAANCLGRIRGARWLRPEQFPAGPVAPHVRARLR